MTMPMTFNRMAAAFAVVALLAGGAFAQNGKKKAPGTDIAVAKDLSNFEDAQYTSIQAAVNAAKTGQVIEILDTEVYEGQITIDGRETSPWPGVTGGKKGITIRYVPPANTPANSNFPRPVILYRDRTNQSPRTFAEAKTDGEMPGMSGNYETCGALRIIRAQGVTIDGIAVDGGGAAPFGWPGIWGGKDPLAHGNAAITLVVTGGAVIRNCELRNAYIGLNVKDRNTGGVFGYPNPNDNDTTIALSGFGKVGNHLIEYNRIHGNSLGIFFESAWDLASTVRYNLIYNNVHSESTRAFIASEAFPSAERNNMASGAIMFKDMVYTPVVIYNNTFHNNYLNLIGHWKIGATHLLFNNIFGKSTVPFDTAGKASFNNFDYMAMDARFPNRMHNSIFSAYTQISTRGGEEYLGERCDHQRYDTLRVDRLVVWNEFLGTAGTESFTMPVCPANPVSMSDVVSPGALIAGQNGNVRWLETTGRALTSTQSKKTLRLDTLFQSVDPNNARFLWPKWDHPLVQKYIQNQGWEAAGIRNADGKIADLGAISSNNNVKQPTLVRIEPSNVVLISGGNATVSFFLTSENGVMNNPRIKLIRWVELKDTANAYSNFGGSSAPEVEKSSITDVTKQGDLKFGSNNKLTIPVPGAAPKHGFFEIVIEGTDASGNIVTSDIGFLPYRKLDYELVIEVFPPTGAMTDATKLTSVTAGDPVRVRVTPRKIGESGAFPSALKEVEFQLLSDPAAFMYYTATNQPLTTYKPGNSETVMIFPVYFKIAGNEVIQGAGEYMSGSNNLAFLGNGDIKVLPGPPRKIEFQDPIPLAQLGAAPAPVINRGVPREVKVQVQDEYGNAVGRGITVNISVDNPAIGDIDVKSVVTNDSGMAVFVANVTNGSQGDNFTMTATMTSGGVSAEDKGKLRVGRVMDRLAVFYGDNRDGKYWQEYYTEDSTISGTFPGTGCYAVTVKAVSPDTVITSKNDHTVKLDVSKYSEYLAFYESSTCGGTPAVQFDMKNGVASFYVGVSSGVPPDVNVIEGGLDVKLYLPDGRADASIMDGNRADIRFTRAKSDVHYAVVYGNGYGQPNEVRIHYTPGSATFGNGLLPPDSVSLAWPVASDMTVPVVNIGPITTDGPLTAIVKFDASKFVKGHTRIIGDGRGMVQILGSNSPGGNFEVLDGIGPILADDGDSISGRGSPIVEENLSPGEKPDVLTIQVSEGIGDDAVVFPLLTGNGSIRYSGLPDRPAADALGEALIVSGVTPTADGYRLVLDLESPRPQRGGWVRFNPSASIYDIAGSGPVIGGYTHENNPVQEDNRWVEVKEITEAPPIVSAYYTNNSVTGLRDSIFVKFGKAVDEAWFGSGAYIKFGGDRYSVPAAGSPITQTGDSTVRIDLSEAWKASQGAIVTRDNVPLEIGFNTDGPRKDWKPVMGTAVDRAKPVLVQRVTIRKGAKGETPDKDQPDMIDVIYSEALADSGSASIRDISEPIVIYHKDGALAQTPTLKYENWADVLMSSIGTTYYKVTYSVVGELSDAIKSGDSVNINVSARVTDRFGSPQNVQNESNHKVPIGMEYEQDWKLAAWNNPFRPAGSGGKSDAAVFVLNSGVAEFVVEAKMRLYDNVGNLVAKKDTTGEGGKVEWTWDGYNGNGRMVGTGTYRLKVVARARDKGDPTAAPIEHRDATSIRFVRGKK
jgi:hypothetical protein